MKKRDILTLLLIILSGSFSFGQVRFDTSFGSGSLGGYKLTDSVTIPSVNGEPLTILSYEVYSRFDPKNPVDTSLAPSARWYYFRMTGVKNKIIYLSVKNSEAIRPFYSYDNKNFERFGYDENSKKGRVVKQFSQDTVYICHYIPYTYERMISKVAEWSKLHGTVHAVIGKSNNGLDIPMIKITDPSVKDRKKTVVWIHGRSHPSETPGSWHLEGLVNRLLADNELAASLRKSAIFYVVPFINPDGVEGGYSRSTATGVNIEINWDRPDSLTMPEVKVLKKTLDSLLKIHKNIPLLLNMHSQIANSATYWIHDAASTNSGFYKKQLLLSNLTADDCPFYSSQDQSFSQVAPRYAEGWMWNKVGDRCLAITFETPYTFFREDPKGSWVSVANLDSLAGNSFNAICDYLQLNPAGRYIIDKPSSKSGKWSKAGGDSILFIGSHYYLSSKAGEELGYTLRNVPEGIYQVFKWVPGPAAKVSPEGTNRWAPYSTIENKKRGKITVKLRSEMAGEPFNAILLKKISTVSAF